MPEFGIFLASEEHGPKELVRFAQQAEQAGFGAVWISDHFHPWLDDQGQSPFVWSSIGGIAATTRLRVTTAVTCPTMRTHPAIIAQAAATSAVMLDGRFALGLGTGENLNEHILGQHWPTADVRMDMLEEAIEVMRQLWTGEEITHHGAYYTVENARLYTLPAEPPPILISGFGPKAVDLAARLGDGYVSTKSNAELVARYTEQGGTGPKHGGIKVCWGDDDDECRKLAHHLWRSSGLPGELAQILPTPTHFDQVTQLVTVDDFAAETPCGPDPDVHAAAIRQYIEAGYDEIYIHQIGSDQERFYRFFREELEPRLTPEGAMR